MQYQTAHTACSGPDEVKDMVLKQLTVYNYKNIKEAVVEFSSNVNCLVGHNGEGKTNVLDAVYYLSFCRSSTNFNDSLVINHDADFMSLVGDYRHEDGLEEKVQCSVRRGHKKTFKRNGKEYQRLSDHIGRILLVMVSPQDQELIIGGSELRRRFMDMVISQYDADYLQQLIRYRKALQQRNSLLRAEAEPEASFIEIYEEEMAHAGEVIYDRRRQFVDEFSPIFQTIYKELSGGDEAVDLTYRSHVAEMSLRDLLKENRAKDRVMGFSLKGLHRDDLDMLLDGFPIKREGSQGQNKTFVIAMKLAQFDFLKRKGSHRTPVLLLDDIFDKLDEQRVEHIVRMVSGNHFGQIFITDTNRAFLLSVLERTGKDFKLFSVVDGQIRED